MEVAEMKLLRILRTMSGLFPACFFMLYVLAALIVLFSVSNDPVSGEELPRSGNTPRGHVMEVPEEVREMFAGGISAEEFVRRTGHVPRAIESLLDGDGLMIVQLHEPSVAVRGKLEEGQGRRMSSAAITSYQEHLLNVQDGILGEMEKMGIAVPGMGHSRYTTVYNGFKARIPYKKLQAVRAMPGVKAVHPAPVHKLMLDASVPLIRASDVWNDFGRDGEGIVVAVIDTGIDYTHASLGGSGDPQDYAAIDPSQHSPWAFPTGKVIGGYDFAGTLYDAGCSAEDEAAGICSAIPLPDSNPLDEYGHGTHVAAIAAGMETPELGAGVAPGADLMAIKIFGKSGSTDLTVDALEWVAQHYLANGYPHVINMSLGSHFGAVPDPSVDAANNAAELGIVVVASAGNSGDCHYITGSPAVADRVISVAASTTGYATGPTIEGDGFDPVIYQPGGFDDDTGRFEDPVTAPLGYAGSLAGAVNNQLCDISGVSAGALAGKIALIQRGGCQFTDKVNNAAALGAVGAIIFNNAGNTRMSMAGLPVDIPAGAIAQDDGVLLVARDGQTVTISAQDDISTVVDPYVPADQIGSFSSRGPRGTDSKLKPDVAAPGVGIFAAEMGSGSMGVAMSGTSMAAPHVAGMAALILQDKPGWTPEEIKALMMNTALPLADDTPVSRSGSGRVDAWRAVESNVVATGDDHLAGINWGVVMSCEDDAEVDAQITVFNRTVASKTFDMAHVSHPGSETAGINLTFPSSVSVGASGSQIIPVTLSLDMTQISADFHVLEEYYGWITLTPRGGGDLLRLPYYFQPRPFSCIDTEVQSKISHPGSGNEAEVSISHTGPVASNLWMFPALIHSTLRDGSMGGPADVRLFGMDYGWNNETYGDLMEVAIHTWSPWHVPQNQFAEFDLYIDQDQDGTYDYVNFNYDYGLYAGSNPTNQWVVAQADLQTGTLALGSPYLIYSDYNASLMEWYLPAAWQGLDVSSSVFDYQLISTDSGTRTWPAGSFDYQKSPFEWRIDNASPGPGNITTTAWVGIDDRQGYNFSRPKGSILVDYRGDPSGSQGAQAYFIDVMGRPKALPGIYLLLLEE